MNIEAYIPHIADYCSLPTWKVKNTISLLAEGATIPFISRYRKEKTGELDEVEIETIGQQYQQFIELEKRKTFILQTIKDQGQLTDVLLKNIQECISPVELEDLYLPFKKKRKTKGEVAKQLGLEPLAAAIYKQAERDLDTLASQFLNENVKSTEEALQGARDIIAEWINENSEVRNHIRSLFEKSAVLISKVKKGKEAEAQKFKDYFDHTESLSKVPSHRLLAIRRGENEGFLKVAIEVDELKARNIIERKLVRGLPACKEQVSMAIVDSLKRLLLPSIENEYGNISKTEADVKAVEVFKDNLEQLLLAAPLGQKVVLSIDPGFRTGCKTVVLSKYGDLLFDTVLHVLTAEKAAAEELNRIVKKYNVDAIAIGNGTASRETEAFVKTYLPNFKEIYMVSEQGASIYSASPIAREEFPNKDVTVRGAVSIGRRLMDPLAELVKIDPKSIGVGQYQHDVNPRVLKESLDATVVSCVNRVGVELNTASKPLLSYVSGLGEKTAENIIEYRKANGPFKSRKELLKVPRLGAKVYEQAAGFLRINNAKNILDKTGVHPERYELVSKMAKDVKCSVEDLVKQKQLRSNLNLQSYVSSEVGMPTLKDIIEELDKPGRDPREKIETFAFANVHKLEDLKDGMELPGIVTNVTAFGCFVDVGVHQDGLVHISQLADRFVKDPNEVVKVHQKVRVKVLEIDYSRKRISLSMKGLN